MTPRDTADAEKPLPRRFFDPLPPCALASLPSFVSQSVGNADDRVPELSKPVKKTKADPKAPALKRPAAAAEKKTPRDAPPEKKTKSAGAFEKPQDLSDDARKLLARLQPDWLKSCHLRDDWESVKYREKVENNVLMYQITHAKQNVTHFPSSYFDEDAVRAFVEVFAFGRSKSETEALKKQYIQEAKDAGRKKQTKKK